MSPSIAEKVYGIGLRSFPRYSGAYYIPKLPSTLRGQQKYFRINAVDTIFFCSDTINSSPLLPSTPLCSTWSIILEFLRLSSGWLKKTFACFRCGIVRRGENNAQVRRPSQSRFRMGSLYQNRGGTSSGFCWCGKTLGLVGVTQFYGKNPGFFDPSH